MMEAQSRAPENLEDREDEEEEEEDDENREGQAKPSGHPRPDDDDDQDQPTNGPSRGGTRIGHSQPPASQSEPSPPAPKESEPEHRDAIGITGTEDSGDEGASSGSDSPRSDNGNSSDDGGGDDGEDSDDGDIVDGSDEGNATLLKASMHQWMGMGKVRQIRRCQWDEDSTSHLSGNGGTSKVGYRHFDTAKVYNSEGFLGEALKDAMDAGLVKREDLFVTSKLWCTDAYPEGVLPALRNSLSALQLEYLDLYLIHWPVRFKEGAAFDLYLIHWPVRFKEGAAFDPKPDELMTLDLQGTWRALEACVRQGLVRAIGVSNFSSKKIMEMLKFAEIPPAVNQVEMHPKWQQRSLRETCKNANVHVSAWSPLGAPLMHWGTPEILNDPIIKDIALKHSKTPAQVLLRWGSTMEGVLLLKASTRRGWLRI
ncbi:hypothetical protein L7F22_056167 [Adiantum nelumboides]|nr:hypothetical protein [Adiantum nelumboides]